MLYPKYETAILFNILSCVQDRFRKNVQSFPFFVTKEIEKKNCTFVRLFSPEILQSSASEKKTEKIIRPNVIVVFETQNLHFLETKTNKQKN